MKRSISAVRGLLAGLPLYCSGDDTGLLGANTQSRTASLIARDSVPAKFSFGFLSIFTE